MFDIYILWPSVAGVTSSSLCGAKSDKVLLESISAERSLWPTAVKSAASFSLASDDSNTVPNGETITSDDNNDSIPREEIKRGLASDYGSRSKSNIMMSFSCQAVVALLW